MRRIIFVSAFFLLMGLPSVYAACSGSIRLALEPTFASPSSYVTPSAYGLSDCDGKTIYFKEDSCSGTQKSSCTVSGSGCVGGGFAVPSVSGTYEYFACIDKNSNANFNDPGEQSSLFYTVGYNSLPEFGWTGMIQIIIFSVIVLFIIRRNAPCGI